jgi:hypothetical protein
VGVLAARGEAQTLRLSMLYALLDEQQKVGPEHLEAALAVWRYSARSVIYLFGDATGDPVADTIYAALRQNGQMTRSEISGLFSHNERTARLAQALQTLVRHGKAKVETRATGGRPTEVWSLA